MAWVKPQYTRRQVDAAGVLLVTNDPPELVDLEEAYDVINNWRSSHSYPLQAIKMTLLTRAERIDTHAVVAQRLKRLSSIEAKLRRFDGMQLSRMHDIGGCRAVLRTVRRVQQLVALYRKSKSKNPRGRPELVRPSSWERSAWSWYSVARCTSTKRGTEDDGGTAGDRDRRDVLPAERPRHAGAPGVSVGARPEGHRSRSAKSGVSPLRAADGAG